MGLHCLSRLFWLETSVQKKLEHLPCSLLSLCRVNFTVIFSSAHYFFLKKTLKKPITH